MGSWWVTCSRLEFSSVRSPLGLGARASLALCRHALETQVECVVYTESGAFDVACIARHVPQHFDSPTCSAIPRPPINASVGS